MLSRCDALALGCGVGLLVAGQAGAAAPGVTQLAAVQKLVATRVAEAQARPGPKRGVRLNKLGALHPAGTQLGSAFTLPGRQAVGLVTKAPSWVFMLDHAPGAHFAHPVTVVAVDANTGAQSAFESDWWPTVNGQPTMSKVVERSDRASVAFESLVKVPERRSFDPSRFKIPLVKWVCNSYAIIVCGYDDLPDSFDEDTNGMYSVVKTLGFEDGNIFYLSPHATHPGVDRPTSIANVQWAIAEVAARSTAQDKVVFLYSSHGNVDWLSCVPNKPGGGGISGAQLAGWLDTVTCKELSVIVEACHSGSLIGSYSNGTYVAAEDNLTGAGTSGRVVMTSASSDTSSWPDVDGADDPNQAQDAGSESVYGYLMAYGVPSADTDHNGVTSFQEGWQYAYANDVTRIRGWNRPQMRARGLSPSNVYHRCFDRTFLLRPATQQVVPVEVPKLDPVDVHPLRQKGATSVR